MPPAAAAAGGAPGADIRGSISYVCALLASAGVGGLSAEALRQAKFDAAAPAERLWRALHDVLALALARSGGRSGDAGGAGMSSAAAVALEAAWRSGAPHGGVPADGAVRRAAARARVHGNEPCAASRPKSHR
jgi:hypothetical protein